MFFVVVVVVFFNYFFYFGCLTLQPLISHNKFSSCYHTFRIKVLGKGIKISRKFTLGDHILLP